MCQHLPEFETLNTRIVVISFGRPDQARIWLGETNTPFTLLLDPERKAYRAYGLEYSLLRSWGLNVWRRYAQLLESGVVFRTIAGNWVAISSWIQMAAFALPIAVTIPRTAPISTRY